MKALMCFLLVIVTFSACAKNPAKSEHIPVSITHVEVGLVGDSIVRTIQHNMELNPVVQVEIMARPDFKIIDSLTIKEIPLDGESLSLKNSSGAFVEAIKINDSHIDIVIDYFRLKGGSILISCMLPIKDNSFRPLLCSPK